VNIVEVITKTGKRVCLSSESWNHLVLRHPEMSSYLEAVKDVLVNPDLLVQSNVEPNIVLYHKYYKEEAIYVVLVVEEVKSFIITGYTSDYPKQGVILWQKR